MKTKQGLLTAFFLMATFFPSALLALGPDSKEKKQSNGYLRHALPIELSFGIDALPADRMMLVTKAPKILTDLPLIKAPPPPPGFAGDANSTATPEPALEPVVTVDPPPPVLSVPAPDALGSPSVLVPQVGSRITTTDQVIQLLELRAKNPSASGLEHHHIVVPFQMPHSQAPSAGVFKSKTETRYIKRIK